MNSRLRRTENRRTKVPAVPFLLICCLSPWSGSLTAASLEPKNVLVLINKDTPISGQVGRMYQKLREIPPANMLSLSFGTDGRITPEQYWAKIAPPIKKFLEANPEVRCILTTSGVPYMIQATTPPPDEGGAFDSQLAAILLQNPGDRGRHQANPLFIHGQNVSGTTDARALKMVYVSRLDGPDLKTITRMVEDAVATEKTGLQGPVFGDSQGSDEIAGYGIGDVMIRGAIDHLSGAGFESKLDTQHDSWKQPPNGVGNQAAGAAFYMGWYDYQNFQDIFGERGLARGSIAWHLASLEAQNIWDPTRKGWVINLMRRGAAVTIGPVQEPYLDAFPRGDIFTEVLLAGGSVAESYWLALPHTSWAMVLLGDPLYRPFGAQPRPTLLARAYVAENASHILRVGQSGALLVQIECVGPPGSSTPAMTATAEAESGLAAASGSIKIPALKAGESTVVRVPSVTAGSDPVGLFRLALVAQDDQKRSRRIVLEGRNGLSRITGGILPKLQMFVRGDGDALITGQTGRSMQIDPATLAVRQMVLSPGFAMLGAEYSPDGGSLAMSVVNPQQQTRGFVIADLKTGMTENLPAGGQFIRWLQPDQVLMKQGDQLIRHSLAGGPDSPVGPVEGCPNAVTGSVIPGTDILYVTTPEGKSCVKKGSETPREVMLGVNATRFGAVANDLSLFGGVDAEKRLWVQHGMDGKPEIAASNVEQVVWGPISRRAVVLDANRKARAYDGRDRSWIDLGILSGAQWSPDEERLLLLEAADGGYLSILIDHRIERLASMSRLGRVTGMVIAPAGDKAFLLAGITGGQDVWMIALPPKTPGK